MYFRTRLLIDNSTDVARRAGPDRAPAVRAGGHPHRFAVRRAGGSLDAADASKRLRARFVRSSLRNVTTKGARRIVEACRWSERPKGGGSRAISRFGISACNGRSTPLVVKRRKSLQHKHLRRQGSFDGCCILWGEGKMQSLLEQRLANRTPPIRAGFWAPKTAKKFRRCCYTMTYDDRFRPVSGPGSKGGSETLDANNCGKTTCDGRAAAGVSGRQRGARKNARRIRKSARKARW